MQPIVASCRYRRLASGREEGYPVSNGFVDEANHLRFAKRIAMVASAIPLSPNTVCIVD